MKYTVIILFIANLNAFCQLTFKQAQDSLQKYHLGTSTYFDDFKGHPLYGAGIYLTNDLGAAGFGDGDNGLELIKLDKTGKVQWRKSIKKQFDETEAQCVLQDKLGNFYVFMLTYNSKAYQGGAERVLCFNNKGIQLWDKMLGAFTLVNNPTVSYAHSLVDGHIELRGHIVKEKPATGKDPSYYYWQGWLNSKGLQTTKTGDVIDWKNSDWKSKLKPE